ncbi:lanthionine synthetase C family protein, partial [Streptomyces prasinus]
EACGLYEGAPAVAYVLSFTHPTTATRALATLDTHVADGTRRRLRRALARIDRGTRRALGEGELIGGLPGVGACRVRRGRGA